MVDNKNKKENAQERMAREADEEGAKTVNSHTAPYGSYSASSPTPNAGTVADNHSNASPTGTAADIKLAEFMKGKGYSSKSQMTAADYDVLNGRTSATASGFTSNDPTAQTNEAESAKAATYAVDQANATNEERDNDAVEGNNNYDTQKSNYDSSATKSNSPKKSHSSKKTVAKHVSSKDSKGNLDTTKNQTSASATGVTDNTNVDPIERSNNLSTAFTNNATKKKDK